MNPHTAAAIAQLIFYVPVVPLSSYLLIANWRNRPRMAWYPPAVFSLIRLVGAILVLTEEQRPGNEGLIIATIVMLNIGLVPLVIAFLGILYHVLQSNFEDSKRANIFIRIIRWNILIAASLLSTSGGFAGQPDRATTQSILSKTAYLQFTSVLIALVIVSSVLYFRQGLVKSGDRIYLKWLLLASPAVGLRSIYGIIGVFDASGNRILTSMWSSLFGSAVAFSLMALLPEYSAVCIYLYLGSRRLRTSRRERMVEVGSMDGQDDVPLDETHRIVERDH